MYATKELSEEETAVIFQGWLLKKISLKTGVKNWRSKYFVLDNNYLTFYKDKSRKKKQGKVCSKTLSVTSVGPLSGDYFAFVTYEKTIHVKSVKSEDKTKWFDAIKELQIMNISAGRRRASSVSEPQENITRKPTVKSTTPPNKNSTKEKIPPLKNSTVKNRGPPPRPSKPKKISSQKCLNEETTQKVPKETIKQTNSPPSKSILPKRPPFPPRNSKPSLIISPAKTSQQEKIKPSQLKESKTKPSELKDLKQKESKTKPSELKESKTKPSEVKDLKQKESKRKPSELKDLKQKESKRKSKESNSDGIKKTIARKKTLEQAKDRSDMNTLWALLDDEIATDFFLQYMKTEYSESQLLFWLEVRTFVRLVETQEEQSFPKPGRIEIIELSINICETFVYENLESTINIGKTLREPLIKWNELSKKLLEGSDLSSWTLEYTSMIFDDVIKIYQKPQYDVFKMLRGSYRRFKKSKHFDDLQKELAKASNEDGEQSSLARGSCLRTECSCKLFVDDENQSMKECSMCNHFYEEHQNLHIELNESQIKKSSETTRPKVSAGQRKKLQLLLGKSVVNFNEDGQNNQSRRNFLFENITAIVNHPSDPLVMKSQRFKLKKYKKCFTGKEFLMKLQSRLKISKRETFGVISEMMEQDIVLAVDKSQQMFIEGKFYYQFSKDALEEIERRSIDVEYASESETKTSATKKETFSESKSSGRLSIFKRRSSTATLPQEKDGEKRKTNKNKEKAKKKKKKESEIVVNSESSSESDDIDQTAFNLFEMLSVPKIEIKESDEESTKTRKRENVDKKKKSIAFPLGKKNPSKKSTGKSETKKEEEKSYSKQRRKKKKTRITRSNSNSTEDSKHHRRRRRHKKHRKQTIQPATPTSSESEKGNDLADLQFYDFFSARNVAATPVKIDEDHKLDKSMFKKVKNKGQDKSSSEESPGKR